MRTACLGLLAALAAVGCSKRDDSKPGESPADETAQPAPGTEPAAAPPPCPDPDALGQQLATLWKLGDDQRVDLLACVPGTFPEPGWFVMAWVDTGDVDMPEAAELRRDLVAGGRLITADEPKNVSLQDRSEGLSYSDFSARDFDGDGVDEIVFREYLEVREVAAAWYQVLRRRGEQLEIALSVPTERDVSNANWVEDEEDASSVLCEATIEVEGNTVVVTGTVVTKGDLKALDMNADGCIDGTQTFVYRDGAFAQPAD